MAAGSSSIEEKYDGYTVYDKDGDKIGKVDDLFLDEDDREEYIGVKMGLFGLSGKVLIPAELVSVNDSDKALRVDESKDRVKDAPSYSDNEDIDHGYEDRVRQHFGLEPLSSPAGRGAYGRYSETGENAGRDAGQSGEPGSAEHRDDYQGREEPGEGREGYRDERTPAVGQGGSGGEESRGEVSGYRSAEAEGSGQDEEFAGSGGSRRRVRRRMLREESEEVIEEEGPGFSR